MLAPSHVAATLAAFFAAATAPLVPREVAPPPHEKQLPHVSAIHRDFLTDAKAAREKHGEIVRFYVERRNISGVSTSIYGETGPSLMCASGDKPTLAVRAVIEFKKGVKLDVGAMQWNDRLVIRGRVTSVRENQIDIVDCVLDQGAAPDSMLHGTGAHGVALYFVRLSPASPPENAPPPRLAKVKHLREYQKMVAADPAAIKKGETLYFTIEMGIFRPERPEPVYCSFPTGERRSCIVTLRFKKSEEEKLGFLRMHDLILVHGRVEIASEDRFVLVDCELD